MKMKKPKFSFVIALAPYRNAEVVRYLKKLDCHKDNYEIIIEKGLNPSENRNKGVKKAKGEIIVFIDDDATLEQDFLKKAEDFLNTHQEIDIVGGPQLTPPDEKGFAKISGLALSSLFGAFSVKSRYKQASMKLDADEADLTSANMLCRKEVFKKVKFDPRLWPGEDPDFISNAKSQGFKVAYSPEIFVYHRRRKNFSELAKQIFSYGKTRMFKESFSQTLKRPYFLVPPLFLIYLILISFYSLLLLTFLNISNYTTVIYFPFIIYILLSLFFSIFISISEKNFLALFLLPIIFLAIHLSYGAGILYGLFKK